MPGILESLFATPEQVVTAKATSFAADTLEMREYFATACPHCRNMEGAWKAAETEYTGPVKFRAIECNDSHWAPVKENADLCSNIAGFPTIKMFKNGEEIDEFQGGRTSQDFVNYAKKFEDQLGAAPAAGENVAEAAIPGVFAVAAMAAMAATSEYKEEEAKKDFM